MGIAGGSKDSGKLAIFGHLFRTIIMKISYQWLKQHVDFDWTPTELAHRLTMAGLEVESVEPFETVKGSLQGVVVGEVKSCVKHPGADKLSLTKVDVGGEELLPIVCGAPNVAVGQKVLVAMVGCTLHTQSGQTLEIKKAKIRGEESQGMICAEDELGLGESHDGILVLDSKWQVGTPAAEVFQVQQDDVLEIGLTPNRVDAASHFGVARDVAALLGTQARLPMVGKLPEKAPECEISIDLPEADKCPLYVGLSISGVKVHESPDWLKNRLKSIGARPINNIVDATNFVLHELGYPLHAFDAQAIQGKKITVKSWSSDLEFITLDGQKRNLLGGKDLLICDENGPVALAGIMGGQNSEVGPDTTDVFLESAWFDPRTIRTTAARLGLKTDASFRFERGADPNMAVFAAIRCASLILDLAGGSISKLQVVAKREFPPHRIKFDLEQANKLMGHEFSKAEITRILNLLEIMVVATEQAHVVDLLIPAYRVDVLRPQDVMEDILRIHGYNNVPLKRQSKLSYDLTPALDVHGLLQKYLDHLAANGWNEIITNPLVPAKFGHEATANLVNNLSEDLAVMRENMLQTGLEMLAYNHNRKQVDLRMVEFAKTYHRKTEGYQEREWIAFYLTGSSGPSHWQQKPQAATLFTLAREMERMQAWFGIQCESRELPQDAELEYGIGFYKGEKCLARVGKVKPSILKGKDIKGDVFFAEVDWDLLLKHYRKVKVAYQPLPKFPAVRRDISMLVPQQVRFQQLAQTAKSVHPKLIQEVSISDVYEGANLGEGKRSYLITLMLQDENKTLTDDVTDQLMSKVSEKLESLHGVEIRR